MGLWDLIKRWGKNRRIRSVEDDTITTMRGRPRALGKLGKTYAEAGRFKDAARAFEAAAREAEGMEVTRPKARAYRELARKYRSARFSTSA